MYSFWFYRVAERIVSFSLSLSIIAVFFVLSGCGGGGGGTVVPATPVTPGTTGNIAVTAVSSQNVQASTFGNISTLVSPAAVSGARFYLEGTPFSAVANANGEILFSDVPSGVYTMKSLIENTSGLRFSSSSIVTVTEGSTLTTTVGLSAAGAVYGKATLSGQSDHSGITVSLGNSDLAVLTDNSGNYYINGISPGTLHSLIFSHGGYQDKLLNTVTVMTGEASNVASVALIPGSSPVLSNVQGTVTVFGTGLGGAILTCNGRTTVSDGSGSFLLSGIASGALTVNCQREGYSSLSSSITLAAGETGNLDFALSPIETTGTISGAVSFPGEASFALVKVYLLPAFDDNSPKITLAGGMFSFSNVPPGSYTILIDGTDANRQKKVVFFSIGPGEALSLGTISLTETGSNSAPVVTAINGLNPISAGSTSTYYVDAYDPDGDLLTYSWAASGGVLLTSSGNFIKWTAPLQTSSFNLTCTASDGSLSTPFVKTITVSAGSNDPPSVTNASVSTDTGDITVGFDLFDTEGDPISLAVDYSTDGGSNWSTDTSINSSLVRPVTGFATGAGQSFVWNSAINLPEVDSLSVQLRITPSDQLTAGTPLIITLPVDNNVPPVVTSVVLGSGTGPFIGDITINYALSDVENDACSVLVEFYDGVSWQGCTVSGATASIPPGPSINLVWNSLVDTGAVVASGYQIRVTPSDNDTGTAGLSSLFTIDNNENARISGLLAQGNGGDILLTYNLSDAEGDPCDILLYYGQGDETDATIAGTILGTSTNVTTGIGLTLYWQSEADMPSANGSGYYVKLVPNDGSLGQPDTYGPLTINNTVANFPPVASTVTTTGTTGDITVYYSLHDTENNACSINVEYIGGSVGAIWTPATVTGSTVGLVPTTGMSIIWNSAVDQLNVAAGDYQIRITPSDPAAGTAAVSPAFSVNNELPKRYALVIGIDDYSLSGAPDQFTCVNDATGVYNALIRDTLRWPAGRVSLLTDSNATKAIIDARLALYGSAAQAGDLFHFYYSGVGGTYTTAASDVWISAYDAKIEDHELEEQLKVFTDKGANVVVTLDASFAGGMISVALENDGWIVSSDFDEVAYAGYPYSLFAEHYIRGFRLGDSNSDDDVTFMELFDYSAPLATMPDSTVMLQDSENILTSLVAATVVTNSLPVVSDVTTIGSMSGDVFLLYTLNDADLDPSDILVEYRGGSVGSVWSSAAVTGAITGLYPSTGHVVLWYSDFDEAGIEAMDYELRITPDDTYDVGIAGYVTTFTLDNNYPPVVSSVLTTGTTGDILITYDLSDVESDIDLQIVEVEYMGGTATSWTPATVTPSVPVIGLTSTPGLSFTWDSAADEGNHADDDYQIRIQPADADGELGIAGLSGIFYLSNNQWAVVSNVVTTGTSNEIQVNYDLSNDGGTANIIVEYRGGSVGSVWTETTNIAGDRHNLIAGPHTFDWFSQNDEPGADSMDYQLRLTPVEPISPYPQSGVAGVSTSFTVDNNEAPIVSSVMTYGTSGSIDITYTLFDSDGDLCDIYIEYSGGTVGSVWTSAAVTGVVTSVPPGVGVTLVWYSDIDEPSVDFSDYLIRITPVDSDLGTTGVSEFFRVDNNEAPVCSNIVTTGTSGAITVTFDITDLENDSDFTVVLEYIGGSVGTVWTTGTVTGVTTGLATGVGLTLDWESAVDEAGFDGLDYQVRITPFDAGGVGIEDYSPVFAINNNQNPLVSLVLAPLANVNDVDVTYTLFDSENDLCDLTIEYRTTAPAAPWNMATVTGLVNGVTPGSDLTFVWHAAADEPGENQEYEIQVAASDGSTTGPFAISNIFNVDNDYPPSVVITTITTFTGDIPIYYELFDPENHLSSIDIEYRGGSVGSVWTTATTLPGPSGDGVTGLVTGSHDIIWRSGVDELEEWASDYEIRISPFDAFSVAGHPGTSGPYYISNNDPPEVSNVIFPGGSGNITVTYTLDDTEGDPSRITLQYSGGLAGPNNWITPTVTGSLTNLSPGVHSFIWNTAADEYGHSASDYAIRFFPSDGHPGTPYTTGGLVINNEEIPAISNVQVAGSSGNISISFQLTDPDGDPCDVDIEYQGGSMGPAWSTASVTGTTQALGNGFHTVIWESVIDEPGTYATDIIIQVTPYDSSAGLSGVTSMALLDNNDPPVVTFLSVAGGQGVATATIDLYDLEDNLIDLDIKYMGGSQTEWTTATMFDVLTGLSTGTALIFEWDTETDENGYHATNYQLQVTPSDGEVGLPVTFGPFEVDSNDPPVITSVAHVSGTTGAITISYDLDDDDGDLCSINVQFTGGTAGATWMNATLTSGETSNISTGTGIIIQWNSAFDQPGFYDTDYQIRITPSDSELGTGSESAVFPVDNR